VLFHPNVGRSSVFLAGCVLSSLSAAQVSPTLSGVIETYWVANGHSRGSTQQLTWAELRGRVSKNWSFTLSGYDSSSDSSYDESFVRFENGPSSIRMGRLRTSFGFSDWSELFYTGFNRTPFVREMVLVGETVLDRDDAGAEVSTNIGPLQLQAALFDSYRKDNQIAPGEINHATVTAQYGVGSLILGAEALAETDLSEKVYGASIRYSIPHWIFKGEAFQGDGPASGSGSYFDASYRIPYHQRTELVARLEQVRSAASSTDSRFTTLGVRQVFNRYVTLNVNYTWTSDSGYSTYGSDSNVAGWSARAMFQVQF
jgi:hypothetical protein